MQVGTNIGYNSARETRHHKSSRAESVLFHQPRARMSAKHISLIKPDDWHVHLRDGEALTTTVAHTAKNFARAIVMPNLAEPVTTIAAANQYRQRILAAVPEELDFQPLMTLYLTDATPVTEITLVQESESVKALKYYPAGATTNSANGVTSIDMVMAVLEAMAEKMCPY